MIVASLCSNNYLVLGISPANFKMDEEGERDCGDDGEQNSIHRPKWTIVKSVFSKLVGLTDRLFDIENQRIVLGFNSGLVAAFITTTYGTRLLTLVPRVIVPPICGVTAAMSWQHFITKKLATRELECPACTSIRGFTIAITSAAILPLCFGGLIIARRSSGLLAKAERFTENFSQNFMQSPILVAAVLAQGSAGWIMASREFEKTLVEKLLKNSQNS